MTRAIVFLFILFLAGCKSNNDQVLTDETPEEVSMIPLVLSDEYSLVKSDVAKVYEIRSTDSLLFDISGYEFILPDPAFTYIRQNIDYPKMLGGSWAYMTVLYNDSLELRKWDWFQEVEENKVFYMDSVVDILNKKGVDEFMMDFRFYIDNDKGLQYIDKFKVRIID